MRLAVVLIGAASLLRPQTVETIRAVQRTVKVYLPPGYANSTRRYPVLYMHDGQNLFGSGERSWDLDRIADQEIAAGKIQPVIIVGLYNSGQKRTEEYTTGMGEKPPTYARLIGEELKPYIDRHYRTLTDAENTGVGGSSLGGIQSLAIFFHYPETFGKLAIMSPSIWWDNLVVLRDLDRYQGKARPRIWLDIGLVEAKGRGLQDSRMLFHALTNRGWKPNANLRYVEAEGGDHNEKSWAARSPAMLEFLFPPR